MLYQALYLASVNERTSLSIYAANAFPDLGPMLRWVRVYVYANERNRVS